MKSWLVGQRWPVVMLRRALLLWYFRRWLHPLLTGWEKKGLSLPQRKWSSWMRKVNAVTSTFESSPNCITISEMFHHCSLRFPHGKSSSSSVSMEKELSSSLISVASAKKKRGTVPTPPIAQSQMASVKPERIIEKMCPISFLELMSASREAYGKLLAGIRFVCKIYDVQCHVPKALHRDAAFQWRNYRRIRCLPLQCSPQHFLGLCFALWCSSWLGARYCLDR